MKQLPPSNLKNSDNEAPKWPRSGRCEELLSSVNTCTIAPADNIERTIAVHLKRLTYQKIATRGTRTSANGPVTAPIVITANSNTFAARLCGASVNASSAMINARCHCEFVQTI